MAAAAAALRRAQCMRGTCICDRDWRRRDGQVTTKASGYRLLPVAGTGYGGTGNFVLDFATGQSHNEHSELNTYRKNKNRETFTLNEYLCSDWVDSERSGV